MENKETHSNPEDATPGRGAPVTPTPSVPNRWTTGNCPNCGFAQAAVDPAGILWCLACGYSKKGVFT